ncbi:MAG: carboxypeptidase regulatory-like domain-containing protein [Phycisphaerae bacterium]|nr:carboxypeptidase regulatory-like domain-containing protein [Phycisphaerae bacterium]MDD5380328.1 carboxypeptidase regulatory-like domain-containing protein [Phycisphaerae bacterium]
MKKVIIIIALAAIAAEAAIAGTIVGVVTNDSNGLPIQGLWVYALKYDTGEYCDGGSTSPDGLYFISGLAAGAYRVSISTEGTGFVREYYDNEVDYWSATAVNVPASGVVDDIDFSLTVGGSVTGIVRDSGGQPIANIQVSANRYDDDYGFGDRTGADGIYEIEGVMPGLYRVMVWADETIYASEYYNDEIRWENATPVSVSAGQQTTGIDFSIDLGASISGVVKNSGGVGQANLQVNCWADDGYGTGTRSEANGFYRCGGLPVGYNYNVIAYPLAESSYMITRITVYADQPVEYANQDIILGNGGLKISGKVTDKATTLPLADVRVGLWNDDVEIWTETDTNANGMYLLTNLPPGEEVGVSIEPESYYAYMGTGDFELEGDINNLDFALPEGAILCGKVLDANTAEPLAGVEVEYDSERYNVERSTFTDADGVFCLTQLPPGAAEMKAMPDVDSGYAWNLPWGSDYVCLSEAEDRSGRIIALEKGALVRGYIKDAGGNAAGIDYYYSGRDCDGWDDADDINGDYQIRLPVGTYGIAADDEELGALPKIVTITNINEVVDVPDMIVYTEENGGQISGEVSNLGGYAKTGYFLIIAFKAGTALSDPNMWYTVQPVTETGMEDAGAFSLTKLPPDVNYDIYLCVEGETPDDFGSIAVRDLALNIAVGTTGITLEYSSQGSTVRGSVKNTDDEPVLGATVLLSDSSSSFGGIGDADCNGEYVIYNVPAGTYTATAVHSKYRNTSTTVNVVDETAADVNTIVMPFAGGKEGPNLNGDGSIDMFDFAELANQWLRSGSLEADFTEDSIVDFADLSRIAENWLSKAIWYQE